LEELPVMSMFSPPRREKARDRADDSLLPHGSCQFILLHPELKGLRCQCVGFALNRAIPGSTCDCGHQACYHEPAKENASVERLELDVLRRKVDMLETELERQKLSGRGEGLIDRLGRLEDLVDKTKAETDTEIKTMYRAVGGLWQNVGALNKRTPYYDDHIEGLVDDVQRMRNRLIDIDDASMRVEDRVEALEKSTLSTPGVSRRRKASTPPSARVEDSADESIKSDSTETPYQSRFPFHLAMASEVSTIQSFRDRVSSVGSGSHAWTVHVSLLPTSSQPFPFEKDTAAYQRCLSRGLHQMVVIPDTDAASFKKAVDKAFVDNLRGRSWHPLVARLCDAENLCGLPMLRQLPQHQIRSIYDANFLQQNCAVNDESGKILDLYIAMSEDTISWAELKEVPAYKSGLEEAWLYDPYLDGPCVDSDGNPSSHSTDTSRPAAGDILPAWSSSSLKRSSSGISRTASFGSTDGESSRPKLRRVDLVGRRLEAV